MSGTWITASIVFGYYVIYKLNSTAKTLKKNAESIEENAESIEKLSEILVRQTEILRDSHHCMREMIQVMRFEKDPTGKLIPPYVREPRDNHKG